MNVNEIAELVKTDLKETLNGINWVRMEVKVHFSSASSSALGFCYYDEGMTKKEPFYIDDEGLQRVKKLSSAKQIQRILKDFYIECENFPETRWNEFTLNLFYNDKYEFTFDSNESARINHEVKTAYAAISGLYESLYERVVFEIKPEVNWKTAVATVIVLNGKIDEQSHIILEDDPRIYPLNLDKFWQLKFPEFQEKTNSDPLKKYFPAWNTLKYYLRYGDNFNEDKDIDYQFINY